MDKYLVKTWGVASKCSATQAYYFKSIASDIGSLRKEIEQIIKKCACLKDYVAVITSVVEGKTYSGHVGVVTPEYNDKYTPLSSPSNVWILPSTAALPPPPPKK